MYNRCTRGHTLLATAFHGLHLAKFIEDMTDKDDFISDLKNIAIQGPVNVQDIPQNIKQVFDEYEKFVYETLAGKRRKTAQFWMQYITIIDLINVLHRAIKCKDPKLFGYAFLKLLPIFLMTNHFNCARWMVLYSSELENLNPE